MPISYFKNRQFLCELRLIFKENELIYQENFISFVTLSLHKTSSITLILQKHTL